MRFLTVFIVGIIAIILVVGLVTSKILPWWGDLLLIAFLIAILIGLVRGGASGG